MSIVIELNLPAPIAELATVSAAATATVAVAMNRLGVHAAATVTVRASPEVGVRIDDSPVLDVAAATRSAMALIGVPTDFLDPGSAGTLIAGLDADTAAGFVSRWVSFAMVDVGAWVVVSAPTDVSGDREVDRAVAEAAGHLRDVDALTRFVRAAAGTDAPATVAAERYLDHLGRSLDVLFDPADRDRLAAAVLGPPDAPPFDVELATAVGESLLALLPGVCFRRSAEVPRGVLGIRLRGALVAAISWPLGDASSAALRTSLVQVLATAIWQDGWRAVGLRSVSVALDDLFAGNAAAHTVWFARSVASDEHITALARSTLHSGGSAVDLPAALRTLTAGLAGAAYPDGRDYGDGIDDGDRRDYG